MANKIQFPLDSTAYLRRARLLFREGKNKEALDFIEHAYELDKDIQINVFYAFMLSQFDRYEEALEIMNEEKPIYMNSENHAMLYTDMSIKARSFIEAEYIIQKYKNDPTRIDGYTWENLEYALVEEREKASLEASIRRAEIKKTLRELEQYSHMVQVSKVREAEILELSELQEVAQIILVSTEISGTVQRYFLELLINKNDENVYFFQWFNQMKKVCPAELLKFDEIEHVHKISEVIEERLVKYPDLEIRVEIEIMHDLLLLYPYIEETITDINFWVEAYIRELDFFDYMELKPLVVVNDEQQKMMKWINYLSTVAQRAQMFTD